MNPQIQQLIGQAIERFQSGTPKKAEEILMRVLSMQSNNLPALEILGLIKASLGEHLEAAKLLKKAIKLNPQNPATQYNLAKALSESKDYVGSLIHHEKALQLDRNNPDGWLNYGQTLSHLKRDELALTAFNNALAINNHYAEAWYNKALVLCELKRHEEALDCYKNTIQLDSKNAKAWLDLSTSYGALNRYEDALQSCEQALALQTSYPEAWLNKGSALSELKRFDEAVDCFSKAIELRNDYADAWLGKGIALEKLSKYQEALNCHDKAIALDPSHAKAWLNKGNLLTKLQQYIEAVNTYDKAIALNPKHAEAWSNKAIPLYELKKYEEAVICCNKAIGIDSTYAESYWNKSVAQLILGHFDAGWANYEYRWKKNNSAPYLHRNIPNLASFQNIINKKILVWSEQGFGDTLQFARYIPKLIALGAKVTCEVQPALVPLLQNQFACNLITLGSQIDNIDFQIPLLSLPRLFETRINSIPAEIPYIRVPANEVEKWKKKLLLGNEKLNIGIACSGSANFDLLYGNKRTIPIAYFSELSQNHNLYLIQKEISATDRSILNECKKIQPVGSLISDFQDTAAIIENMDLIISVDTSLVHLAGSLGKKMLVLLPWSPEWRWLTEGSSSPWYPSATLIRQSSIGDWGSAMEQVKALLRGESAT